MYGIIIHENTKYFPLMLLHMQVLIGNGCWVSDIRERVFIYTALGRKRLVSFGVLQQVFHCIYACIAFCFSHPLYYVVKNLRGNFHPGQLFLLFSIAMWRTMCRFALFILLASSLTIATFVLDTFESSLWSAIIKDELSSSGPIDSIPRMPEDVGIIPVSGSGDMMIPYQDQGFITEDAEQELTGTVDSCNLARNR